MPFLPVDLDGKKNIPRVALATGTTSGAIAWGLLELWEYVWQTKKDVVGEMVLDGCFGPAACVRDALATYDFLEKVEGGWRVRGAAKFLGISVAQSAAGKARSAGQRNSKGQLVSSSPSSSHPAENQLLHPTPNTQHPTPSKETAAAAPGATISAPTTEPDTWSGLEFWAWAQSVREAGELLAEKPPNPRKLSAWFSEALMREGITIRALQEGFHEFGQSKYWETTAPPYPFRGFMAQWDQFTRPEVSNGAAA